MDVAATNGSAVQIGGGGQLATGSSRNLINLVTEEGEQGNPINLDGEEGDEENPIKL